MFSFTLAWLYGVLFIASVFITAGMVRLFIDRLHEREPRPTPDMYLTLLFYAGMHGIGGALWWGVRGWDALINDKVNPGSYPVLVLIAALAYTAGKGGLVYASSLNGKPIVWRLFVMAAAFWSVAVWWSVID